MCIAIVKDKGIEMPSAEILERCWNNNPDGAGYMWKTPHGVQIRKGFMKLDNLLRSLDRMKFTPDEQVSIHFRLSTHGGISPHNTHPFPLSSNRQDLKAIQITAKSGMVHNGIFDIQPERKRDSDTQEFVRLILAPLSDRLGTPAMQNLIEMSMGGFNKIAILDQSGFTVFGDWITDDETGLQYSNEGYQREQFKRIPPMIFASNSAADYGVMYDKGGKVEYCWSCEESVMLSEDGLCRNCTVEVYGE